MYLVLRNDPVTPDQVNDLAWRNSGDVLRGTVDNIIFGVPLRTEAKPIADTRDAYLPEDISTRGILDITGTVDPSKWGQMETIVSGINGAKYDYELPVGVIDSQYHVSNSNAVILTALNAIGVDVRSLIGS
jgi:hypothetical protein